MTGIRLNLSHTELAACQQWTNWIKEAAQAAGIMPKLLIDLQGPELRIGELERPLQLKEGNEILLKPLTSKKIAGRAKDTDIQDDSRSMIPVPEILWPALRQGQQILLDDGKILLIVEQSCTGEACCRILRGGLLTSRKSIALSKTEMKLPTLTESDHKNIQEVKKHGITGVMLPFVRRAQDLQNLKQELEKAGASELEIFAKIENLEGVRNLNDLLPYADHIVIARGDLGNRMPLWELPVVQAKIAAICKEAGKPFMVVTSSVRGSCQCHGDRGDSSRQLPIRSDPISLSHGGKCAGLSRTNINFCLSLGGYLCASHLPLAPQGSTSPLDETGKPIS